jgi:transcriptional regulator with XRE-family HTH domain
MAKLPELFSQNLVRIRLEKGFKTQESLAKHIGLSVNVIKHAEAEYGLPSHKNISKLAAGLGVEESQFFSDSSKTVSSSIEYLAKILAEKERALEEVRARLEALTSSQMTTLNVGQLPAPDSIKKKIQSIPTSKMAEFEALIDGFLEANSLAVVKAPEREHE